MMDELERYRYEKARAWLEHIHQLGKEVDELEARVDADRALFDGMKGIDYTREKVAGTPTPPDIADVVDRLLDNIRQYTASLAAYTDERTQASRALDGLADPRERRAIRSHYLHGKPWAAVCDEMGYSKQHMMEIRRHGVSHCYELMPHSWRDPRHSAI